MPESVHMNNTDKPSRRLQIYNYLLTRFMHKKKAAYPAAFFRYDAGVLLCTLAVVASATAAATSTTTTVTAEAAALSATAAGL